MSGGDIGDRRLDLRSRPVWYPIHSWESYSPNQDDAREYEDVALITLKQ